MKETLSYFGHGTYLVLLVISIAFPLLRSFEPRVRFVAWWPALAVGLLLDAAYFIPTDIWFTAHGIWSFSDVYTLGPRLAGLPIEEWLFFLALPYACVFIYACVKALGPVPYHLGWSVFGWALVLVSGALSILNPDKAYTCIKLGSASAFLALYLLLTDREDIGNFLFAYLLTEIPFLLINGVLTYLPVVSYNDAENLGIRMGAVLGVPFLNIPIEDNFYSLMMLTLTVFGLKMAQKAGLRKQKNSIAG